MKILALIAAAITLALLAIYVALSTGVLGLLAYWLVVIFGSIGAISAINARIWRL